MSSEMRLVHFDQASTTLLYFSPWVIKAVVVLLLEFLGERAGLLDDLPLRCRTTMSSLPNEMPAFERIVEAERH